MVVLTRENFKEIMDIAMQYQRSMCVGGCFSSSDVRRETTAINDVSKMIALLVENGVDVESELEHLVKAYGGKLYNGKNFVKKDEDFQIKFKSHLFDRYLTENHPELLVEDEVIVEELEFCKEVQIGSSRFTYQLWDVNEKSIEYLKSNCSVYKSAVEILDKCCNYYSVDAEIKEIQCIRDNATDPDINCSEYLILIKDDEDKYSDGLKVFLQLGGSTEDAIITKYRYEASYIIPLDGADRWMSRAYSPTLNDKLKRRAEEYDRYKAQITA